MDYLKKIFNYYKDEKFIKVSYEPNGIKPILIIGTPFFDSMEDSITLYITTDGDNSVRLSDSSYTSFNIKDGGRKLYKFELPDVKKVMNFYHIHSNGSDLYSDFNFKKELHNFYTINDQSNTNAWADVWSDMSLKIAEFLDFILYMYNLHDMIINHKYKLNNH